MCCCNPLNKTALYKIMIELIEETGYLTTLRQIGATSGGISANTYLSEVEWPDGEVLDTYVKIFNHNDRDKEIINESFGYVLANNVRLRQSTRAALIKISVDDFPADQNDQFAQKNGYVLGWATVSLTGKNLRSLHFKKLPNTTPDEWHSYTQALFNWPAFPKLIAFDDWIGNIDRNPGNLVFIKDSEFAIIDHGRIFGVVDWRFEPIDPDSKCENMMLNIFKYNYRGTIIAPILYSPIIRETTEQAITITNCKEDIISKMNAIFSQMSIKMNDESWGVFLGYIDSRLGTATSRIPALLAA